MTYRTSLLSFTDQDRDLLVTALDAMARELVPRAGASIVMRESLARARDEIRLLRIKVANEYDIEVTNVGSATRVFVPGPR